MLPNNQIACGCLDGSINIWNLDKLSKVKSFKAHDHWPHYLLLVDETKLISSSSGKIISGSNDKTIRIWDLETFECIKLIEAHWASILYLELTPDGNLLSCAGEKVIKLWNIETGEMLKSFDFEYPAGCVQILNDDLIAVSLHSGQIQIYSLSQMKQIKTIEAHPTGIYRLKFLAAHGNLLSGSNGGEIKVWKIFD